MKPLRRLLTFAILVFSSVVGLFQSSYASWVTENGGQANANDTSQTFPANTQNPVCYNSSTNVVYASLKTALDAATSGQYVYMFIGVDYECQDDLTIKSGVHLVLPFIGKHFDSTKTGGNISSSPLYQISSSDDRNNYGNTLGDANASSVSTYRSICLKMRGSKDIVVNGYLHLGGVYSTNGNNGYYSEINLGFGSSITLNSGSTFDCYGYVKENSADYSNPNSSSDSTKVNNELDQSRFIDLKSGAKMATYAALYDSPSAGALTTIVEADQCPFWEYDFPAIQTYLFARSGCTLTGRVLMVGPNSLTIDKEMTILQGTASGESMFYLTSGYIGMEYLTSDPLYSSRSFNARHTNLVVNGAFSVGYLYASEGALGVTITIDTRDCFLPVSCRETIIVESGFSFTTDKKLKFLAGSSLVIKENGTFNINNEVIFHKSHSILKNATNSIYYGVLETTSIADAKLLCNGLTRFNSASGSKGALGAYVEHNSTTGNAVFDTQNLGSDAKLTVTDVEGSGSVSVIVTTTGPFETEVAQFSYGTSYTSANSASNYYWEGDFVSTYDVTVQIASGVTNGVVQYTIQSSESSDGSNATDTTLVDATTAGTTSIPRGRYLKIVLTRGQSAVIKDPSGNVITNNYTDIVLVNKNLTVVITPNETYTVQMINSLADGAQSNGRGHVDFEIWECKTQNGTYSKVFSSHCIEFTERVSQGSYFYMVRKFDNNIYNYYKNENAEITKNPSGGTTPSNWNLSSTQQSPKYYADANYVFQTYWTYGASGGGGCVTPETLVTMADGSQKQIQYVTQGEMIQVFNHETGQIDVAPVTFNEHDEASLMTVNTLRFSDGSSTEYIYEHGYFDVDLREYVYFQDNNAEQYIGHRFLKIAANGAQQTVSLVSVAQEERWTDCYELPSFYHLNFIADGFLSMPGGIKGLFNIFELDENFKYDEVKKAADIAQYGLFTREELAEYGVDDLTYDAYPAGYLKVSIGKGIMTEDDLMYLIERYGKYTK